MIDPPLPWIFLVDISYRVEYKHVQPGSKGTITRIMTIYRQCNIGEGQQSKRARCGLFDGAQLVGWSRQARLKIEAVDQEKNRGMSRSGMIHRTQTILKVCTEYRVQMNGASLAERVEPSIHHGCLVALQVYTYVLHPQQSSVYIPGGLRLIVKGGIAKKMQIRVLSTVNTR